MKKTIVNPDKVKSADIIVGMPSYNEADNIDFVAEQASKGLSKYYPKYKSVIINCDNNSPDGTKSVFLNAVTAVPKIYISTPPKIAGKGYNFENLFHAAKELGAKIIVVVDADLKSITPEWIKYFADPIIKGYDYVTPVYVRHKYDGTITNNITYPLTYGLFGKNIRQPIGGDFAFSRKLASYWLQQKWNTAIRNYGIDIFQTAHAVMGGFKVCQTGLGSKKHKPSAPKLGPMFLQVVESLFEIINKNTGKWKKVKKVEKLPLFGLKEVGRPQSLTVSLTNIKKQASDGYKQNQNNIRKFLSSENFELIAPMFRSKKFSLDAALWVTIVYDIIASYAKVKNKNNLIEALRPLYFARVASFIQQTEKWSTPKAEKEIERQAGLFFKKRDYLISKL